MNEENKSQDDGYQEIDISTSQPDQQPEQQQAETPVKQEYLDAMYESEKELFERHDVWMPS